jgi:hypothetical protein
MPALRPNDLSDVSLLSYQYLSRSGRRQATKGLSRFDDLIGIG